MPKKKTPELDPKEQFKRFEEAAKKAGVDKKGAEQAFSSVAKGRISQQVKK
jgi:hypothetical protein